MRRNPRQRYNNSEGSSSRRRPDPLICYFQDGGKARSAVDQGFCLQHGTAARHENSRALGTSRHEQNCISGSVGAAAHHVEVNVYHNLILVMSLKIQPVGSCLPTHTQPGRRSLDSCVTGRSISRGVSVSTPTDLIKWRRLIFVLVGRRQRQRQQ